MQDRSNGFFSPDQTLFLKKLSFINGHIFNKILNDLFIWRLHISIPRGIELDIDTMVLDNDGAFKRERARNILLNVTRVIYETINIEELWKRCQSPPQIQFAYKAEK
jgi:hypothetical protein